MDNGLEPGRHRSGPVRMNGDLWTGYFYSGQDALAHARDLRAMARRLLTMAEQLEQCYDEAKD